ncbi:MAG: glycosyltransferase family 4 protein [candidate division NC10 bacterium]|nr:glycosyltransferase family 4 protein [candidate division NC10 bacterium]
MSLLFLAPGLPSPGTGGGSLRMFHMVRFLGDRVALDLVAPASDGVEAVAHFLRGSCREMEFVLPSPGGAWRRVLRLGPYEKDPALAAAIRRRLTGGGYAAVQVEKPAMLPYVPADTRIPIILDTWAFGLGGAVRALRHERGIATRARNLLRLARFSAFDAFCWPDTYCILVVSEVDRERCLRARPDRRVLVVPNGVDCAAVRPGPFRDSGPPVLLFTGDMGFAPNVDAALLLAFRILPEVRRFHPDAELRLAGRNPDPRLLALRGPGVVVTGKVADMTPHLNTAMVYVAPHFTGAGTRTKLLEAMAAGLPIVTTSLGIEGIAATPDRDVQIADDPATTVTAILRLLANSTERRSLGAAARRLVEERYEWSRCLAPLETLYAGLLPVRAARC